MAEQWEYFCDVAETGRFDRLHANMNDLGRKGWHLVAVLPYAKGELLLIWERRGREDAGG